MANSKKSSAFWPRIENTGEAELAVKMAGGQYMVLSFISAIMGVLIFKDALFLIEPLIFGILGWLLMKYRNLWLSIFLALWCLGSLVNRNYNNFTSLILPIALIGISINSLRGTYFLFKNKNQGQNT